MAKWPQGRRTTPVRSQQHITFAGLSSGEYDGQPNASVTPKMRTYFLIRSVFVYVEDTRAVVRLQRGAFVTVYISENHKGITWGTWDSRRIRAFATDVEDNALHTDAWWGSRVI